jgi:hypothetical protein
VVSMPRRLCPAQLTLGETVSTFSWCLTKQHELCRNSYERFVIDAKNQVVFLGEIVTCECPKRGCKCYVPAALRGKKTTRRKK